MATSGIVGVTTISTAQVIDHAYRRCKLLPQQITSEMIATAKRLLWMKLTMLNARGILLSAIDTQLVGLNEGKGNIATLPGNISVLNSNLRQISRISGTPSTPSGGSAGNAYDEDLSTACTNTVPNGNIDITFDDLVTFTQVGFVPAASGVWNYLLQWSPDGAIWNTFLTVTAQAVSAGQWLWYELDGVPSAAAFRLQATNGTTLNVFEIVCGNNPSDIPLAPWDRDTWTQIPNKSMTGRPTDYYWDRRLKTPIFHVWPTPGPGYLLTYMIVNYIQRQLQDVGSLPQGIEIPDRWNLPVIADLAREVAAECKEVPADLTVVLDARADALILEAWNAESDGAPVKFLPDIGCYTA